MLRLALSTMQLPTLAPVEFSLPFRGRAESFQFLGLGRMDAARRLCTSAEFVPVPFGDGARALVQVSLMRWKQSPVGPYIASFVGIAVKRDQPPVARKGSPRAHGPAVLSAFLRTPRILFVPTYTVGDMPGGPPGCAEASRAFGRQALGMTKTHARFATTTSVGLRHVQALEERKDETGRKIVTGYAFSLSVQPGGSPAKLPISPRLLLCRELFWQTGKSLLHGGVNGTFLVPAARDATQTVCIGTHFTTRPRLLDLASDTRASFTPLVLDRPAPIGALGTTLEALDFFPFVLAWDPDLQGSISGSLRRPEDALV